MSKREPVDRKRCQGEHQVGVFQLGGEIGKLTRCENKAAVVVKETVLGEDGLMGAMSLCTECLGVFKKQMVGVYEYEEIRG